MQNFRASDFDWLADLHKTQCYTTCDWANPAKSADFGSNGYTASLTDWHELLQLTAPDPYCGIVFVRGGFPDTPDAILARAQRRGGAGGKGTFGAQLIPADYELGERRAQGLANFRWPYMQYELKRKSVKEDQSGTYELISFIRDNVFFTVIRIVKPGDFSDASTSNRHKWNKPPGIHKDGPSAGQSYGGMVSDPPPVPKKGSIDIRVGGTVRFGCPCSNASPTDVDKWDTFDVRSSSKNLQLSCSSSRYLKRLEIQFFNNGRPVEMVHPLEASTSPAPSRREAPAVKVARAPKTPLDVDVSVLQHVELSDEEPTILVCSYAIRNSSDPITLVDMSSLIGIDDYLGIASHSLEMTDRLWSACRTTNCDENETVEVCAIARCAEQILGVSSVPMPEYERSRSESKGSMTLKPKCHTEQTGEKTAATPMPSEVDHDIGIALVHNIMTAQYVDLQSTFWQVRLLVKLHQYFELLSFDLKLLEEEERETLTAIRSLYILKLRNHLRSVLVWILQESQSADKFLLPLATKGRGLLERPTPIKGCLTSRAWIKVDRSCNHICFATMTVWYVLKHCPQAITPEFKSRLLLSELGRLFAASDRQESRSEKESTPKNDILHWYHLSCLSLICQETFEQTSGGRVINGYMASGLSRQEISRSHEYCEKIVKRLRKSQPGPYSLEDEEVDRLFLLGEAELGLNLLESTTSANLAAARARQTKTRLTERKRTSTFDPGPRGSTRLGKSPRLTSNAPWELTCLNHHSLLRISSDPLTDISTRTSRDNCFEFVLADYTFMTSWDRAVCGMVGAWWDLEPSSVICATIIDLKTDGKLDSATLTRPIQRISRTGTENAASTAEQQEGIDTTVTVEPPQRDSLRDLILQLRQEVSQSDQGPGFSSRAFDWLSCKPSQPYHLKTWVQSLDDTPEVYKLKQTKDVVLRREVIRYFKGNNNDVKPPEWTLATMSGAISPEELQFLSMFDLCLTDNFTLSLKNISYGEPDTTKSGFASPKEGQLSQSSRQDIPMEVLEPQEQIPLQSYQKTLLTRLNDSLVDLGTKYRILFAERCCPSIVQAFIYIWHPDALDTFDNYFGASSRFADTREAQWTTSITISHWSIRSAEVTKELLERFEEPRQNGDFPPVSVAKLGTALSANKKSEMVPLNDIVEERSSSLVITGDTHGYCWISSIWSSLTNNSSISTPISSLPHVLQLFIHQQASGRCLVFLVLLGHLCEKLAGEYEVIILRLDTVVELGEKVLLEGLDWEANDAPDKLKKMLWGLEALRVFDDRLSSSLSQIQKAKETMDYTIQQEAGKRHIELLQEYNNVLEEFGKRYSALAGVQLRIQLKIRQVTGLRDGISAVTNVDDSRTTIKQGSNIRVLTLITIAYLPLGFVTALFSVNHDILPTSAGTTLYAVLTVIFVVTTYGLALSLEKISSFIYPLWARLRGRKQTGLSTLGAPKIQESSAKDSNTQEVRANGSAPRQERVDIVTQRQLGLFGKSHASVSSGFQGDIEAGQGEIANVARSKLET